MEIDVLEVAREVAPLVVEQQEQVEAAPWIRAPEVVELLPNPPSRDVGQGSGDLGAQEFAQYGGLLPLEKRSDRPVASPRAQLLGHGGGRGDVSDPDDPS